MLTHLRIRNLALVADLSLELRPGFNAITGETGAGKSILIGALNLLLGQRADRTLVRAGCEACAVEAVLEARDLRAPLAAFLTEHGLEAGEDGVLLLKRTFSVAGANRQFINGSPASLQTLESLGDWLVDIHGPHDHQSLFQPARQLELLDAHASLGEPREAFAERYERRERLLAERAALVVDEQAHARQLDLLRHQVQEIAAARLEAADEEALANEHERARNAARLLELAQASVGLLGEHEDALLARAGQVGRLIQELVRLDGSAAALAELHGSATEQWRELQGALSAYAERVDLDPARLQALEERIDLVQSLKRKYGGTVAEILAFEEEARARLARLEGREEELRRLEDALRQVDGELEKAGLALGEARRRAIPKLARAVRGQLRDLGFRQGEFGVAIRRLEAPRRSGWDAVEFQFAPNPGEPARPLRAIASSGELARVMLALKTVLAAQDEIPIVVFDEVDANVGGETARALGLKMREIGRRRQVLCITHLAPVAAAGDAHYVVTKTTRDGRTVSEMAMVEGDERVAELARMLGGGPAARQHAAALLRERVE